MSPSFIIKAIAVYLVMIGLSHFIAPKSFEFLEISLGIAGLATKWD